MANLKNGTLNYFLTKDLDALENRENALKEMNKMDPTYPDPNDPRFTDPAPVFTILDNSLYRDNVLVGRIYDNKTNKLINITNTLDTNVTAYDTEESATGQDIPIPTVEKLTGTKFTIEEAPDPYEYVDLGLPSGTLWAKMNIGATSETELGNFYQLGKGARTYDETVGEEDATINLILTPEQDAATQSWGIEWHMPTAGLMRELIYNTTHYVVNNFNNTGVRGVVFVNNNDDSKYIFIPAGYLSNPTGQDCFIWGSSYIDDGSWDNCLSVTYITVVEGAPLSSGFAVRPVKLPDFSPLNNLIVYRASLKIHGGYSMYPTSFSSTITNHDFNEGLGMILFEEDLTYIGQNFVGEYRGSSYILNISIPESIIELSGINYCNVLTVNVPTNTTALTYLCFYCCYDITKVVIPDNVISISESTLNHCTKLETIEIGSGIQQIENRSLQCYDSYDHTGVLKTVTIKATVPPIHVLGQWDNYSLVLKTNLNKIIPTLKAILVPAESVNAYKTAEHWSDFASIIYPIGTDPSVYDHE